MTNDTIKLIVATAAIATVAAAGTVILVSAALRGLLWIVMVGLGAMA